MDKSNRYWHDIVNPQDDCCIGHGSSLNHRSCNGNCSQMHFGKDKICLCAGSCKVEKLDDILPSSLISSRVVKVSCLYRNSIVLCYSFLGDRTLQIYSSVALQEGLLNLIQVMSPSDNANCEHLNTLDYSESILLCLL